MNGRDLKLKPDSELPVRVLGKINKTDSCWLWTGTLRNGYGCFGVKKKSFYAHRFVYETLFEKIPEGLHIDHLCRITNCVNPNHLEPVTTQVNTLRGISPHAINARKTHCIQGHEFTTGNTITTKGGRACRECSAQSCQEWSQRNREQILKRKKERREANLEEFRLYEKLQKRKQVAIKKGLVWKNEDEFAGFKVKS